MAMRSERSDVSCTPLGIGFFPNSSRIIHSITIFFAGCLAYAKAEEDADLPAVAEPFSTITDAMVWIVSCFAITFFATMVLCNICYGDPKHQDQEPVSVAPRVADDRFTTAPPPPDFASNPFHSPAFMPSPPAFRVAQESSSDPGIKQE
ncbi:hypothetical protein BSKO_00571 [Bryopsis sp. KO-2023]|nr:hypothetical protein BSKO_00571 [Bryopsis sp. KO-2023]